MIAQLKHVRIILSQNGDCVTLLSDHQPRLLLISVAKVDSIELQKAGVNLTHTKDKAQVDIWLIYDIS